MIKIRVKKTKPKSIQIDATIFTDERASLFARGLLCTILAKTQPDMDSLLESIPDDPDKVYRAVMELRKLGYCKRVKVNGVVEFRFQESPVRKRNTSSVLKNKSPLIYSKSMAHTTPVADRQSPRTYGDDEFDEWDEIETVPDDSEISQPSFLKARVTAPSTRVESVAKVSHSIMQRICFLVESKTEALTLNSRDRGRIASALGKLASIGADLSQLNRFEDWWNSQWRSKDKLGAYQPPTPEQVVQFWVQAMKHNTYKPKLNLPKTEAPEISVDLMSVMRDRAESRNGK